MLLPATWNNQNVYVAQFIGLDVGILMAAVILDDGQIVRVPAGELKIRIELMGIMNPIPMVKKGKKNDM